MTAIQARPDMELAPLYSNQDREYHSPHHLPKHTVHQNTPSTETHLTWNQMAERLGYRAINQKVAGSISGRANDVVSLGFPLENVPVLTVSRSG